MNSSETLTWRWASLVAQMVKNLPAMLVTCVQALGWKDPLEREWQPTPVFWPGESHGQKSLAGYSPWGHRELDTTERVTQTPYIIKMRYLLWMDAHLFDPHRTPSFTTLRPKDSGQCTHLFIHSLFSLFIHLRFEWPFIQHFL